MFLWKPNEVLNTYRTKDQEDGYKNQLVLSFNVPTRILNWSINRKTHDSIKHWSRIHNRNTGHLIGLHRTTITWNLPLLESGKSISQIRIKSNRNQWGCQFSQENLHYNVITFDMNFSCNKSTQHIESIASWSDEPPEMNPWNLKRTSCKMEKWPNLLTYRQ